MVEPIVILVPAVALFNVVFVVVVPNPIGTIPPDKAVEKVEAPEPTHVLHPYAVFIVLIVPEALRALSGAAETTNVVLFVILVIYVPPANIP